MSDTLEIEKKTYEEQKAQLLSKAAGKFVLIKGGEVLGIFDTELDAIREGYRRLGNVPMFVKQILEVEPTHNFMSSLLAF